MNKKSQYPETLMQAIRHFADDDICQEFVEKMRWPEAVKCLQCGSDKIGHIKSRRMYQCKECRKQFSVKKGTIFEDSALSLDKWLCAIWMMVNAKNGVSSYEIARSIGITQKSAWHMQARIRKAMELGTIEKLTGEVEVDESFIGGKAKNMHKSKRAKKIRGKGYSGKAIVLGMMERDGEVRIAVIANTRRKTLHPEIYKHVEKGSTVYTDALASYEQLDPDFVHETIDHAVAYVDGRVHTNSLENYWSLFKRCIKGTHISIEPYHIHRYLAEQAFRFNRRKQSDRQRFESVCRHISGKKLTYGSLISEVPAV